MGTAQFGLDYGINNKRGKIPRNEVFEILTLALKNGINTLDTAYGYGNAEKVIGQFINRFKIQDIRFKIISKLPNDVRNCEKYLNESLKRLHVKQLYGYLFHDFEAFKQNKKVLNELQRLKSRGLIKKIGFSLYYPKELDFLLENKIQFDIAQVPYSVLDQRFAPYFSTLRKLKVEIYVRSVFLQGLLFKKPEELKGEFMKIKSKLTRLSQLAQKLNIPVSAICLNFAVLNKYIDKVVMGIDSLENLRENLKNMKNIKIVKKIYKKLLLFRENDEKIIVSTNWS